MKSTKELAEQLGLLRRRSTTTNQQSRDVRRVKKTNQVFSYLIVIDFESTCWKDRKNVGQEVIEFPAVLLNTSTGSIESEFHTYVLPEENPQLSAFCTELTGITQDQVESGIPLRVCLSKFSRWLKKLEDEKNIAYNVGGEDKKLCTFVTWSDWDLSVCLHYECRRKQLLKPPTLNSWIDLRATYKNFYERKPNGLHGALQDVGIKFHGRQHSGVDDARNTASLAWRMMCDGCIMKITRTMPGPQQLKRKQAAHPSAQPPKLQANPSSNLQKREKDPPLQNVCTEHEDRLVSYTQGLCEEMVHSDVTQGNSSSTAGHFKIWEDVTTLGSVHSVIRPKTSLPSTIEVRHKYTETGTKSGEESEAVPLVAAQTNLGAQSSSEDEVFGKSNRQTEAKLRDWDKAEKEASFTGKSVSGNKNTKSSSLTNGRICSRKMVPGKTDDTPTLNVLGHKSTVTNAMSRAAQQLVSRCMSSETPKRNSNDSTNSPRTSYESNHFSTFLSPSLATPNTPAVFKTPLNTPVHKRASKVPPSCCFKTPYAPRSHRTPGSDSFKTPTKSNRTCMTSSLFEGKITPPMCQCGRRAKRRTVQSPGPNINRPFYSCALGRRSSEAGLRDVTNTKKGCGYFKWESMVLAEKRQSLSASSVKQHRVVHAPSHEEKSAASSHLPNKTVTPVGFTGKRLGIAMRAVLRQKNHIKT